MGTGLSPYTKNQIMSAWLSGNRRREISAEYGISTGATSNVIEEWRSRLGRLEFDSLREFVIECRRSGITTVECALGMRIIALLRNLGIKEDKIYGFINQIYDKCHYYDISPDTIVNAARQVVGLVNEVPIPEIPKYIQQKVQEKVKFENETEKAVREKNDAEAQLGSTLQNNAITMRTLNDFSKAKDFLSKYNLRIESDLPKLVNLLNNSRLLGFDPNKIVGYFSNIADLEQRERKVHDSIAIAHDELNITKNSMDITFKEINENKILLDTFEQLNSMGFGFEELLNIKDMASEFEAASDVRSAGSAIDKDPLVRMVIDRLRKSRFLEKEIESLENQKSMLQQEIVQQTEIYTKHLETAGEKAIERIVDYSKRAIESIGNMEDLSKKQTSSSVSDSDNSAPAATKVNQEISSEAIKEG
jgi:chaperonin cofactor prefoldin